MPILSDRGFFQGHYALELEGQHAGWLYSAEGGEDTPEITLRCGTGMTKGCYNWIKDTFDRKYPRKSGAIHVCDYDGQEIARHSWADGLITEVGLPALDASSKDAARLTVKVRAGSVDRRPGSGDHTTPHGVMKPLQPAVRKHWLSSAYSLQIDGLNDACWRVNKIDGITLRVKAAEVEVGHLRHNAIVATSFGVPNLVITLPQSHADLFYQWSKRTVIEGNVEEKQGTLSYLTAEKDELFRLDFNELGIIKITSDKFDSGSEHLARVKVEMYCEGMSFSYASAAL
jgi:hypothetical protein